MATPTITPTTSVLSLTKGVPSVYQPYASDSPTGWTATGLPAGMSINATTGRISGTPTETGVFNVPLIASNGEGAGAAVVITMGVLAGNLDVQADASLEIDFDLRSGAITIPEATIVSDADAAANANLRPALGQPILYLKADEKFLASIGAKKSGVLQNISLAAVNIAVREYAPETKYALNDGTFETVGSANTTRYQTVLNLTASALDDLLSNYEGDDGTFADLLCEIELITNYNDGTGVEQHTRKSRSFVLRLEQELN